MKMEVGGVLGSKGVLKPRWVYTGARVNEISQLKPIDITVDSIDI
jgi:hypothetical protein